MKNGADVCVTVTLVDGLVLARSVFHHSMNYRSVVIFGKPREITDALGKVDLFKGLPLQYRQLMASTMNERGYAAGDTVFARIPPPPHR